MKNILQYFEKTCEQFPNHIAVANESSSVTFNDLKTRSQQAGTMIASELKQDSLPVAIYIDKSLKHCSRQRVSQINLILIKLNLLIILKIIMR